MVLQAIDFLPWYCPECKRVAQICVGATWVTCAGGYIMVTPVLIPWHKPTACYRIPESEADPLTLLQAMRLDIYIQEEVKV